ncbi:MAG: response regulator [Thermodesulfobacteriota bacterium]|nr:response regulator [Thermodesulfobacteriota bacterium]
MNENRHTILCVDDEENVLRSLKRLLRKSGYRLLTASGGEEGLKKLEENDVHLVMCDQRMVGMSGTEFLARVKVKYPNAIRIILTGYTEVDSITESINKGHIYKFFLKPWNDQNLALEIRQALDQYDLIQANKKLHEKILEQNEELRRINENLEGLVLERTNDLEIQNQALELSRAILDDLPIPIIGVSAEGMIVLINREVQGLAVNGEGIGLGKRLSDFFSDEVEDKAANVLETGSAQTLKGYRISDGLCDVDFTPLSGKFLGKGVILAFVFAHNASRAEYTQGLGK